MDIPVHLNFLSILFLIVGLGLLLRNKKASTALANFYATQFEAYAGGFFRKSHERLKRIGFYRIFVIFIAIMLLIGAWAISFGPITIPMDDENNFVENILKEAGVEMNEPPQEYGPAFAAQIVDELIPTIEQELLVSEGYRAGEPTSILFDYGENGKLLSLQKYFDQRGLVETKSIDIEIDRLDAIKLRHQIMIGTDRAHWREVKKASSYPNSPFVRVYVLVQREGEKGRMTGLSFYEGSFVELEYEGEVNEKSIELLIDITMRVAERHPNVYFKHLKEISEGPLFENDPVLSRPDLPDPDVTE